MFEAPYATLYDRFYEHKNYGEEARIIEGLIGPRMRRRPSWLLDLGCGTGTHALHFSRLGFSVIGVDRSMDMLEIAATRPHADGTSENPPLYVAGEIANVAFRRRFDAIAMLFAVFGYQVSDDRAAAALRNACSHLADEGRIVFDFWYAPAVETIGFRDASRVVSTDQLELTREVSTSRTAQSNVFDVKISISGRTVDGQRVNALETHRIRAFTRAEVQRLLNSADLDLIQLTAFPGVEASPSERSWNVLAIAGHAGEKN